MPSAQGGPNHTIASAISSSLDVLNDYRYVGCRLSCIPADAVCRQTAAHQSSISRRRRSNRSDLA